jgi:ubiquinone/menaquinone biosynthesis C-methylase UbiE
MADFLKVDEVLSNLDLKEDMLGAEFGCGSALFTVALARKLNKGRVYGLDIQEEKLSALKGRLSVEKISNVITILCDLESNKGSTLRDSYLDIVLIPNILFQSDNKHAIMTEAKRVLKSGGQILIIDWLKRSPFNQKENMISPDDVKKIAEELGLFLKKEFAVGDYHYGLLFLKRV